MRSTEDKIKESTGPAEDEPTIIPTRAITPSQIDADALKVVRRLQRFGHDAYLVGGCVRDLLLKRTPKDFDVVTSARPQDVRKLFRNCRLIGRRFRLAHIHFRGKIVETATFRAAAGEQKDGELLIRSDNVFGTEREDAYRRDFTVNALFYDPEQRLIIDHVGGLEDLVGRILRFIGQPDIRVQEDPVRIMRAIKFAARLNFAIEADTWRAMMEYREQLRMSAPPRLLEEILRMLRSGAAEASFRLLWTSGVLDILLPELACFLGRSLRRGEERDPGGGLWAYLRAVDREDPTVLTNAVLLAAMLLHPLIDACGDGAPEYCLDAKSSAPGEVARVMITPFLERLRLPKRDLERMQQILSVQQRLQGIGRNQRLPKALMRRTFFPEALDLFSIGVRATRRGRHTLNRLRDAYRNTAVDRAERGRSAPTADRPEVPPEEKTGGRKPRRRRRRRPRRGPKA